MEEIAELITSGKWTEHSVKILSLEWELAEQTVANYAVQARRRIKDTVDKPAIQRKLTKHLDRAIRIANEETFSRAKASEAISKAVDVYAKVTHVYDASDAPKIQINIGADAASAVLDAIYGPASPPAIDTTGHEVLDPTPALTDGAEKGPHRVPEDLDPDASLPDDGSGGDEGLPEDFH